jgi:uncharacterized protein (TIGR02246 family)
MAPAARPAEVRVRSRRRGRIRVALLAAGALAAILATLTLAGLAGDGSRASSADPVGEGEVRDVVERFASAYAREDARAMARTLSRDAERVAPGDDQRGRAAVVAEYRRQFAANAVTDYELDGLDAAGGAVGRAEGDYVVTRKGADPFAGRIVFSVLRESGRPRIALIAATPSA